MGQNLGCLAKGMVPVFVVRAFRLPTIAAFAALTLSGCMGRSGPVATAQPRSDLDALAYGPPPQLPPPTAVAGSGGALAALSARLASVRRPAPQASSPYGAYAAISAAPAAEPPPVLLASSTPSPSSARFRAPVVSSFDASYRLDAGDRLRIVVYGQEGLTNTYAVDASGAVAMPLIGPVTARGRTAAALATEITGRLRNGYIREPSVAVEIEAYRPFFILGEVAAPGQYPYVPNMTVESAVAIAGGFSPRAKRDAVGLTHATVDGAIRTVVPLGTLIDPGDTVQIGERWF
jgi:polysaccharide export outer membrane protein